MQNNKKTQLIFSIFAPLFVFAFLVFPGYVSSESVPVHTGTVRICSVLANVSGPLASADATTPEGVFSLSLSATTNFSSPVLTHNFNAKAFAHNTSIGGIPMHCTDVISMPFGQYYYNNVSVIGNEAPWEQSKYFDGIETFSLNLAVPYNNALFTEDTSDDITINNVADGVVVVDETKPHRTVIVLNTYANVFDDTHITPLPVNPFCANNESMTYPEFVAARTLGKVTYALDTSTTTRKATVVLENTTGCTIPMSLSSYKMFDGIHLSTQEYFSGTPEIQATSSTIFTIPLPSCLAQVDFWYGTAPRTLLDNYNYGDLPLPVVLTWALPGITGVDANGGVLGPYCTHATNTPPTITLIGANPAILTVGQPWVEPGATASDLEDGNITNNIVITGTVTTTPGTYTLTYTVTDSGGLSASTTRQVIVENGGGGGPTTGSITFCSIFANKDNVIATSSAGLPFGSFAIKLATTTDIANSTIQSKTWTANSFAPNRKIILSQNDADCVTYSNLPFGSYYYSELGVTGSQWIISSTSPKYNDQFNTPVNNIFDLFSYSPELYTATTTDDSSRNVNADGQITLSVDRREHTLVMATKYADVLACMLPEFTSQTTTSGIVGTAFSFTLSATSTTGTISYSLATTSLPAGLSFSGNTISGTPTASGTFSVVVSAINPCGTTTEIVVITIAPKQDVCTTCGGGTPPPACTSNCGGGGGNGPIVTSLAITNEKVVEITPGVALVTWNTNLPATKEVGYGNASQPASFITAPFGYATSTVRVSSPLELTHSYTIAIESGKTYYFRPVSTDGKTTVAGIELVLNPGTGIGGGNENSCYYLFDYLKKGWNNNPVEVKKLQVFLRDLEGFNVEVTGIYDDQTIVALNAFQNRYKDDILTPWGHTASTSFTYITTKKKVNEIYCKMAFPVTAQQQVEIDAFRAFLLGLSQVGVTIGTPTEEQLNQPVIINTNEVGTLPVNNNIVSTSTLGTLAGTEVKSTTTPAGLLTANVLEAGKKLGNFAVATFTWPWDWAQGWFGGNDDLECSNQSVFSNWFNWILIIIIITMTYLWYRERQANKKALEVNEELDLLNK